MKILFDCRYTRPDRHDGISRFTAGLVTALAELHPVTMLISDERQLAMLPDLPWVMGPSPTAITEPLAALYFNKFEPDVVYTPMQTMGPWGRRFRLVTTVHDLIYYRHRTPPRNLAWPVRLIWRAYHLSWGPQKGLLVRADAHIAVSETTKQLMIENALTPHPITVVSNAVDSHTAAVRSRPDRKILVYMGSFMPYKNVDLLARGMHLLPGYELHIMSRASMRDARELREHAPGGSLVFHDGASDEEYFALLNEATALVHASRDEGFGLPLVEAMAAGTPVVVSDIPIFREVGGDAARYFDETSPRDFADAVLSLDAPGEWERRSTLGIAQAEPYRWERAAERLLAVLREVAEG